MIIACLDALVKINIRFGNYKKCIISCQCINYMLIYQKRSLEQRYYYKTLAFCYQKLARFEDALQCLIQFLILCWRCKDKELELQCLDMIGMQYYYLGDIPMARMFHSRFIQDIPEPERNIFIGIISQK